MPDITYIRKDDPVEVVRITSQEKMPNGRITFEFLLPVSAKGRTSYLRGNVFHALYENSQRKQEKHDPERPTSTGTKDQWRDYALWLEREYGHQQGYVAPITLPAADQDPGLADPDTLGPIGRRARV